MYELWIKVVGEGDFTFFGTFPDKDSAVGFAHTMAVFLPQNRAMSVEVR